jgi:hypothetical protein
MKLKIIKEEPKKAFEPIKMEMSLETPEEARLFYHVLNRANLREAIFDSHYSSSSYNSEVATDLGNVSADYQDEIENELKRQGIEL